MHDSGRASEPRPQAASRLFLAGLVITASIGANYTLGCSSHAAEPAEALKEKPRVLYYVDPMHPAYRSDKPGKAPDCGMELKPVYAESTTADPGKLYLTQGQQQTVPLETETMRAISQAGSIHTVGRVEPDEALTYRVSAGVDGWVRRVFSDQTGTRVKNGEALAAFFSKDVAAPQQAYIYALESYEQLKHAPSPTDSQSLAAQQLAIAHDNLEFLGMGEKQIEELARTRREFLDVNLTAPADGRILERHIAVGQRFAKGDLLYRIANLDRVWVSAEVPSGDLALLGSVTKARIRPEGQPSIEAHTAAALPQFDEFGRTGALRLEVKNSSGNLLPGMIVNVDLEIPARSAMTVHADAIIDSGNEKHVFLAQGNGHYELRTVETGSERGDRVEIRSGLKPGDEVVTSGAFLLDSESRLRNPLNERTSPSIRPQ
jgi:Cu(I)/Ag(I) efflux system membrane fusion protein